MLVYCAALTHMSRGDVTLPDLFEGSDAVQLTDGLEVYASAMRRAVGGGSAAFTAEDIPNAGAPGSMLKVSTAAGAMVPEESRLPSGADQAAVALAVSAMTGLADTRAAKSLGLDIFELTAWSYRLWGASFGRERDRRAGPEGNAQRRGQVTRGLFSELRTALAEGDH